MSWVPEADDWKGPISIVLDPDPAPEYNENHVPGVYVLACIDKSRCRSHRIHTTKCTSPIYVGQTSESIYDRIQSHLSDRDSEMYELLKEIMDTQFRYWFLEEHDDVNRAYFEHSLFWYYGCRWSIFNRVVPSGERVPMEPPF